MDVLCLTLIFAIATKHINEATTLHSVASVSPLLSWPCCASFPTWSFLPIWYLLHFMLHPHSLPPHPSWSPPLPPTHLAVVVHLLFLLLLLLTTSRWYLGYKLPLEHQFTNHIVIIRFWKQMNVSTKTNSLQCTFTEEVLSLSLSIAHKLLLGTRNNARTHHKKQKKPCRFKRPLVSEKTEQCTTAWFWTKKKQKKKKKQWTKTPEGLPSPPLQQNPLSHKSFPTHSFLVIHHPLLVEAWAL
jgi:hypothetical protein